MGLVRVLLLLLSLLGQTTLLLSSQELLLSLLEFVCFRGCCSIVDTHLRKVLVCLIFFIDDRSGRGMTADLARLKDPRLELVLLLQLEFDKIAFLRLVF